MPAYPGCAKTGFDDRSKGKTICINTVKLNNPGIYTALFEADIEKTVNESDGSNNQVQLPFTVK